ncbi:HD domain-containing protein, partial [Desulfobacterales bacterium HSG16]|nr:HD domain-containing protein [Desulfobacterales bacterium HSG16]
MNRITDPSKIQNLERENIDLQDYIDMGNPGIFKKNIAGNKHQNIMDEIIHLAVLSADGFNRSILNRIATDVVHLFNGSYPGYRACNTMYHDLEHTQAVVLSTARLVYGAVAAQGHCFSSREIIIVLAAAFFHDIGFIQIESDTEGTGAKYTVGHELRSIEFIKKYLAAHSFTPENIEDCKHMIMATVLNSKFANIPFRVQQIQLLAQIVGAADLMAQVADRLYLEKLLLLYREFVEDGIVEFKSEFDLLEKTHDFYEFVYLRK